VHPIAFHFGPFTVHWYGIFVALGFILGFWTASQRGMRDGIAPEKIMDFAPWVLAAAIIGARAWHVVSYWDDEFAHKPFSEVFMVQKGGLVFYGGFITGCIATVFYTRWKKIPFWKFTDALAPSVALGHAFGRLGCLMTGCCYGKECHLPWAVRYPVGHDMHPVGGAAIPVHPTQVYESLLNFGLFLALAWLHRRKKFDGQIVALYLMSYAILRSFVELFRADYKASEYFLGAISPGQMISIFIFLAGITLFWKLPRRVPAK
jgi:phosphatidylglycerol:prolipoprotein diacylglycerol transferase